MEFDFPLEEENKKLQKLVDVSLYLTSTLNLQELLHRITDACKEVLETEDASIILYDEEEEKLHFYLVTNEPDKQALNKIVLNMGQGIAGYVASKRGSLIVNDARNNPRHDKRADESTGKVTRNLIAIPLIYQERLIGVMEAMNKIGGDFSKDDLKMAISFGNVASVAIINAELHEKTENNLKKIQELEKAKTEFISVISHELRTPLTPIQGYIEMLLTRLEKIDQNTIKKFLNVIKGRVSHLHMLIKDLFIVNEVDEFSSGLPLKLVDMREIIKETVDFWNKEKGTHPVNFKINGPPESEKYKLNVDKNKLEHCLYHLMDNGGKFSESGKDIDIILEFKEINSKEFIQIIVKDYGIGISEEYKEKIFDKFFQVSSGMTREYGGLGIGLFICKKIVTSYNGFIFCNSESGKGSEFYIQIPIKEI